MFKLFRNPPQKSPSPLLKYYYYYFFTFSGSINTFQVMLIYTGPQTVMFMDVLKTESSSNTFTCKA